MKAALYLRVGAGQQAECHSAAESQKEILMALAKKRGMAVQEIYEDIGFSGLRFDRPALQALLRDAEEGQFDSVLVFNLSRLGRDSFETAKLLKRLQESGLQVSTPNGAVDETAFVNTLFPQLVNQYQRQHKEQRKQVMTAPGTAKVM